jgi:hypothetical protein
MLTIEGFLHPEMLSKALAIAKTWVDGQHDSVDAKVSSTDTDRRRRWVHLSTSGFSSSPIKWRSHDPGWGIALGQGRSYEDEVVSSRSQGMGKGGKGIFDAPNKGQEKMNRFKKLRREAEQVNEDMMLDGQDDEGEEVKSHSDIEGEDHDDDDDDDDDDDEGTTDSASASSSDDSSLSEEDDIGFDAFNQTSKRSAPHTGKQARRKRAKQVKRRGHLRKGHAEREGAVGGSGGEEGWGLILFGRRKPALGQEAAEGQGQGRTEQPSTSSATARVIWWENVEGDTRS